MAGTKVNPETKRKNLSFFLMIFPSLLLSIIPSTFGTNTVYPMVLKILILMYQYLIIKNFVESVYN